MIHVGIAIAILMGSLLLGVSIPFAFGAGTIYMYTMLKSILEKIDERTYTQVLLLQAYIPTGLNPPENSQQ